VIIKKKKRGEKPVGRSCPYSPLLSQKHCNRRKGGGRKGGKGRTRGGGEKGKKGSLLPCKLFPRRKKRRKGKCVKKGGGSPNFTGWTKPK